MTQLSEFFARHPLLAKLARHAATAAATLAMSVLLTVEFIGPAIIESCQTVVMNRLYGL